MSYCPNPDCPQPQNPIDVDACQSCGTELVLNGRYRIGRSIGQGGFGATFIATDVSLPGEPACVIKQLRPSATSPSFMSMARELFEREAQTLGRLGSHPHIPRLLDYFEDSEQFYLVQEYVSGNNLQEEVKRNGPFTEADLKEFLSEILPMLQFVHSQQVIHRDIKPANIIRRELDRKLVLIDFGAVKNQVNAAMAAMTSDQTALTSFAVGTPGFAPAEQMAMRPVYASDIYSLGVTCIYLLTGRNPKDLDYDPTTGVLNWEQHVNISDRLKVVLRNMMEIAVRDRYQSANETLKALALESYMDGLSRGLVQQPINDSGSGDDDALRPGDKLKQYVSPQALKLAQTIREQRARRDLSGIGTWSGGRRSDEDRTGIATALYGGSPIPWNEGGMVRVKKLTAREVRDAYEGGRRDFSEQNMTQIDLQTIALPGARFHEAKLARANFRKSDLNRADFGKADLRYANFRDALLNGAYLSYANLENADLRGANLSAVNFMQANLQGANLCGANLTNAVISDAQLEQAKVNWATTRPDGKRAIW
ncbi:Pentapeptide repeats (8 copies)/protein kinase domain protein [Rubidibacter lacunae KORDI 51-2]|uniref:Serine/threonine-protein kinase B n=1 Tax=Rubidibacter lacunae KORDI 51-2 TaxID=582515 RepID=U5DHW4_9CHRO|nr:serine/threonine-protein kinase [Rubidibacter lacunae]ERN40199.1 Pentapeptide repeats (8 copies)/protein kinase domain protein [Rubidibacter lacunae KORDI 51-2]